MSDFVGFPPLEANFTPTPNPFFDYVVPNFPPCVVSVVATIIRATLGWSDPLTGEKRIEAELSLADIQRRAKMARNSAREGVRGALAAGLIVETAQNYATSGARYALRWSDGDRQRAAIERQRKALDDEPLRPKAMAGEPERSGGQKVTRSKSDPVKIRPPYKEKRLEKKKDLEVEERKAFNVRSEDDQTLAAEQRTTRNASGMGIYALRDQAVAEVVVLTGDDWSLRRFQQLWEVAEAQGALDAWKAAIGATQRRLRAKAQGDLDRPGAYFDRICVQELEKRGVFLPTIADKLAEPRVGEVIRQELFADATAERARATEAAAKVLLRSVDKAPPRPTTPTLSASITAELEAALQALEAEEGSAYITFLAYVAAERARFESEIGSVGGAGKKRLMEVFDQPRKRVELFRQWKEHKHDSADPS